MFYVHGEDALFVAREFFGSLAGIKYSDSNISSTPSMFTKKLKTQMNFASFSTSQLQGLPYLYIRDGMEFSSVLRLLLFKKNCQIEIWKNQEKTSNWFLHKKGSPGNLEDLEEWLGQSEEVKVGVKVMAIQIVTVEGVQMVGVSVLDTTLRKFLICEFPDDEQLSNLEVIGL